MAKVLFINPNKWGRGITPIWIATHSAVLKSEKHNVKLFDSTFYSKWSNMENIYNTNNEQYKPTNYENIINYNNKNIRESLQTLINEYKPDIIFWSALSSHIHGEGEYVNIQYGYDLINGLNLYNAILVTAGIQVTASPELIFKKFEKIDYLIQGESEFVLAQFASKIKNINELKDLKGLSFKANNKVTINERQDLIHDLDKIPNYDYSIFDEQIFLRPYNGKIVRALDYELSRGCIYTCSYCVETVIQNYYGFKEKTNRGALIDAKKYLRSKSAIRIYDELCSYAKEYKINFIRCQDTNFLTINKKVLKELEEIFLKKPINIKLYIETRPEGINESTAKLLKNLKVDGVGMGIELAGEDFREDELNRYSKQDSIFKAFEILRKYNIKRTSYNIIGLPNQNEESIKRTIEFNKRLSPDNVTVAFYSPYLGTEVQKKSHKLEYFDEHEDNVDGQLRSLSKNSLVSTEQLNYYKQNFKKLVMQK